MGGGGGQGCDGGGQRIKHVKGVQHSLNSFRNHMIESSC